MADNSRKKQNKTPLGGLVVFLVIILANILSETSSRDREALLPVVVALVFLAAIVALIAWVAKKAAASAAGRTSPTRGSSVGAAASRDIHGHTAREAFSSPDAYCLVCDQTNTDHFERDRQRRLRQLDYWLSIGLIDRKEYRTLKARYDQSVPHSTV